MTIAVETSRLDMTDKHWELLESAIDQFVEAWRNSQAPPILSRFLPKSSPQIRKLVLVELIKVDLDYRWRKKASPRYVEDYLTEFPELVKDGVAPSDLVYEEFHIRGACGEKVERQEYYDRFPQLANELARLLEIGETCTSSVAATRPTLNVEVGKRLDDFEVLAELGRGAFARVFLARQCSLDRTVAIKLTAAPRNEARLLAQLDHPHIVRVYDQRTLPDGAHWLLYMEYVAGGSLADVVRMARGLPPTKLSGAALLAAIASSFVVPATECAATMAARFARYRLAAMSWPNVVCWIGAQLAMALQYAHQRGILHRDLKPANILLTADGVAKLADFNVGFSSKLSGMGPAAYFGGTLLYMSPEQLEAYSLKHGRTAEALDGRSDIYSLGVVLWELLTGKRPFVEPEKPAPWLETTERILQNRYASPDIQSLDALPFDCPQTLKKALAQCLEPNPDQRYQDAGQLAGDLRLCLTPQAEKLLQSPQAGWRGFIWRHSMVILVATVFLPGAVAVLFDYFYNQGVISQRFPQSLPTFRKVELYLAIVLLSLGTCVISAMVAPIVRTARAVKRGSPPPHVALRQVRVRCLRLGFGTAVVGLALWLAGAICFPIMLHAGGVQLASEDWLHLMASPLLCGLVAAAYPFFGVTAICIRFVFPSFLTDDSECINDQDQLQWLGRVSWVFLALAALMPMICIMLLIFTGNSENRVAVGALCFTGSVGFGLLMLFARGVQRDIDTLVQLVTEKDELAWAASPHPITPI